MSIALVAVFVPGGSVGASVGDPIPPDIKTLLETRESIELVMPSRRDVAEAAVAAEDALAIANGNSGFVSGEPTDVAAYLVRFTDRQHGTMADDDGEVIPIHVGKRAWLVIMRDVDLPVFGPIARPGRQTYRTTVAHFIDATTGAWSFAVG